MATTASARRSPPRRRNHAGLVYLSWKGRQGNDDPPLARPRDSGQYGLRQILRPDGTFDHWGEIDEDVRPGDRRGTRNEDHPVRQRRGPGHDEGSAGSRSADDLDREVPEHAVLPVPRRPHGQGTPGLGATPVQHGRERPSNGLGPGGVPGEPTRSLLGKRRPSRSDSALVDPEEREGPRFELGVHRVIRTHRCAPPRRAVRTGRWSVGLGEAAAVRGHLRAAASRDLCRA